MQVNILSHFSFSVDSILQTKQEGDWGKHIRRLGQALEPVRGPEEVMGPEEVLAPGQAPVPALGQSQEPAPALGKRILVLELEPVPEQNICKLSHPLEL
jgi:hypothetical protein